jgi:hypothetical protein
MPWLLVPVPSLETELRSFVQRTSHRAPNRSVYLPPAGFDPPAEQLICGAQGVSGEASYVTTGAGADEVEAGATDDEAGATDDAAGATEVELEDDGTATILFAKLVLGAY